MVTPLSVRVEHQLDSCGGVSWPVSNVEILTPTLVQAGCELLAVGIHLVEQVPLVGMAGAERGAVDLGPAELHVHVGVPETS